MLPLLTVVAGVVVVTLRLVSVADCPALLTVDDLLPAVALRSIVKPVLESYTLPELSIILVFGEVDELLPDNAPPLLTPDLPPDSVLAAVALFPEPLPDSVGAETEDILFAELVL